MRAQTEYREPLVRGREAATASWFHFDPSRSPQHFAPFHHLLQHLPIPEGVHRSPEALIFVAHEQTCRNPPDKWLNHKLLTISGVFEISLQKNKING